MGKDAVAAKKLKQTAAAGVTAKVKGGLATSTVSAKKKRAEPSSQASKKAGAASKASSGKATKKTSKKSNNAMSVDGLDAELIKHRLASEDDSGRTLLDRQLEDFCNEQTDDEMS